MNTQDLQHPPACAAWSNRLLIISLLGIAYLTLFPFQVHFEAFHPYHGISLLLGSSGKESSPRDFFLNVLLFVPFGFAISAQARQRGRNPWKTFLWALAAGAFVSYAVEFMQLYIPERDSGWEDVLSNTTGSVAGFFLFELVGSPVLAWMLRCEDAFVSWLSPRRTTILLFAYFAVCFAMSAYLQSETRLSNWDPQCVLLLGNDASGRTPWAGRIVRLQIWNRALPEDTIRRLAAGESAPDENVGLLALYDFRKSASYQDQRNFLPELEWTPTQPQSADGGLPELGPKSWLSTKRPAEKLTREIQKTNQFTVRVVCAPAAIERESGRIVSLSESTENVNFHLRQRGPDLVFYIRNPLSETRSVLAWGLPNVFKAGKTRDIEAIYDGSDAFVYIDGIARPRTYRLGPGASLFHAIDFIQTPDLEGYVVLYHTFLFLPAGLLIGLSAGQWFQEKKAALGLLALGWVVPAVLLEALLTGQSGRRIWAGNIALSLVLGLAGMLLINADGLHTKSRASGAQ